MKITLDLVHECSILTLQPEECVVMSENMALTPISSTTVPRTVSERS